MIALFKMGLELALALALFVGGIEFALRFPSAAAKIHKVIAAII
jgi:hypothetical protein